MTRPLCLEWEASDVPTRLAGRNVPTDETDAPGAAPGRPRRIKNLQRYRDEKPSRNAPDGEQGSVAGSQPVGKVESGPPFLHAFFACARHFLHAFFAALSVPAAVRHADAVLFTAVLQAAIFVLQDALQGFAASAMPGDIIRQAPRNNVAKLPNRIARVIKILLL